jgi:hypothetical protein
VRLEKKVFFLSIFLFSSCLFLSFSLFFLLWPLAQGRFLLKPPLQRGNNSVATEQTAESGQWLQAAFTKGNGIVPITSTSWFVFVLPCNLYNIQLDRQ